MGLFCDRTVCAPVTGSTLTTIDWPDGFVPVTMMSLLGSTVTKKRNPKTPPEEITVGGPPDAGTEITLSPCVDITCKFGGVSAETD